MEGVKDCLFLEIEDAGYTVAVATMAATND